MGIFDFIDKPPIAESRFHNFGNEEQAIPEDTPVDTGGKSQKRQECDRQHKEIHDKPRRHRKQPKPEKLKFLKPCSLCGGREFVHGRNNGFFCTTCQPGVEGRPVIALGHRRHKKTVEGLPCADCGSTTYSKEKDGYLFPDGKMADGWHCGGKECRGKLLTGNKGADQENKDRAAAADPPQETGQGRKKNPSGPEHHFKRAFPWLMDNLPELLAAGWTRPALFRRGNCSWPAGNWGVAWSSAWIRENLVVSIGRQGRLSFSFSSGGRQITQTAVNNK